MNLRIISAGAGSGKTYRLTSEMAALLQEGVRPSGIIATTFTNKAAAELQERVRVRLLEDGLSEQADELTNALIGTVHSLGVKLLQRFAYEAGVSPAVDIIADEDQQLLFNQSLATVLTEERVTAMERLCDRLGLHKREYYDWRREVKQLSDVARANDFSPEVLRESRERSFSTFQEFLPPVDPALPDFFERQAEVMINETIEALRTGEDYTKVTQSAISTLVGMSNELRLRGHLFWHDWVKIAKLPVGAKSRDAIADLQAFAQRHEAHPAFQEDIRSFIDQLFEISMAAIQEFDRYKKQRGLIDYTDMEVLVKRLLEHPAVKKVLAEEIDLLMVDEFQDTNPIQLEIFLKLSQLAKFSVWVGDPKQSIYGFRGAEPRLMDAIIRRAGGVKPADIQTYSWRSRQDIVYATNALFTRAFPQIPVEQVALQPKRRKEPTKDSLNRENEPIEMGEALLHWHFQFDGGRRQPGRPWTENCIAETLRQFLEGGAYIQPKGKREPRLARPGDVAILCRSNAECQLMAEALHRSGLKAAIARSGLLHTAEAKLIQACLKYLLHQNDSLSVAEILLLAGGQEIETIIEDRLAWLELPAERQRKEAWAAADPFIQKLDQLRERIVELTTAEILELLLEEMDLWRPIVGWGAVEQRLDNVDVLRKMTLDYEEACNRLHTASSLGGLLLWLNDLATRGEDRQGSGESPDAVNVLTYHKSKGLEWPVVICHSLEGRLRAGVWGVEIVSEREEVDLNNVLGNRWLRYWVNPYSDQFRNTALEERIDQSDAKAALIAQALQEEARLLYVGVTRARDYLIFPSTSYPTRWLNRVWHEGQEDLPTLDPAGNESPWEWDGHFLNIETESYPYPRDFTVRQREEETLAYWPERSGRQEYPAYEIDLRKEKLILEKTPKTRPLPAYAAPLEPAEGVDSYQVAKALKAYLTGFYPGLAEEQKRLMAGALLDRFELGEAFAPELLIRNAEQWHQFLNRHWPHRQAYRKYPVRYLYEERLFATVIDLVLETEQGYVLIQNSGFAGAGNKWNQKVQELAPWLFLARAAVRECFQTPVVRTCLHFVFAGRVVEVEWKE
jgi:ATP-dependent exoDNAse (exonuclease V) beta subunit